jgi:hypothetical protein
MWARSSRWVGVICACLAAIVSMVLIAVAGNRVHELQNDELITLNGAAWLSRHFPGGLVDWTHVSGRGFERLAAYVTSLGHGVAPDAASAFQIQHWLMAAVWASSGVWTFLLAREVGVGRLGAGAAGAIAVFVPWRVLGTSFLNSTPAYATVPVAAWLTLRAAVRPGAGRDVLALFGLLLVALARTGNLLVALILPLGILGAVLAARAPGEGRLDAVAGLPRRHPLIAASVAGCLLLLIVLGPQKIVSGYPVHGTTWSFFWGRLKIVVAQLGQGLLLFPAAIGGAWMVVSMFRSRPVAARAFAFIGVAAFIALAYASALAGPEERYVAPVAPLLIVAFVAAIERREVGLLSSGVAVVLIARAIALQPPVIDPGPYGFFTAAGQQSFTRLILGHASLWLPFGGHHVLLVVTLICLALVAALAFANRGRAGRALVSAAVVLPFAWCAVAGAYITKKFVDGAGMPTISWKQRAFVDQLVGDRYVGALEYDPTFAGQMQPIWREITGFNRQIQQTVGYGVSGTLVCCGFDIRVSRVWGHLDDGTVHTTGRIPRYLVWIQRYAPYGLDAEVIGGESYLPFPAEVLRLNGLPPRLSYSVRGASITGDLFQHRPARLRVFRSRARPTTPQCLIVRLAAAQGYVGTPPRRYEFSWAGHTRRGKLTTAYDTFVLPIARTAVGDREDIRLAITSSEHLPPSQPIATLGAIDRGDCATGAN